MTVVVVSPSVARSHLLTNVGPNKQPRSLIYAWIYAMMGAETFKQSIKCFLVDYL